LDSDAEFVSDTVLDIAFPLLKAFWALLFGALAKATSWDEHMLGPVLETSSTGN
jgi:hypothetical protein